MRRYKSLRRAMPYNNKKERSDVYIALVACLYARIECYLIGDKGIEVKLQTTLSELCDYVLDIGSENPEDFTKEQRYVMLRRYSKYMELLEKGERGREEWDKVGSGEDFSVD